MKTIFASRNRRNEKGQQTAEFGAAIVILVLCIFVPLINLAIIPVRYGLAQTAVSNYVRNLSLSEKASAAFDKAANAEDLKQQLLAIGGVTPKDMDAQLVATSSRDDSSQHAIDQAKTMPTEWLPDGDNCPCSYSFELKVDCAIEPLFLAKVGGDVPGLTAPFKATLIGRSQWENLGRDPVTREFYLNE